MATDGRGRLSAFAWNAGGWFGTQLGCTLWLLILGFVLFSKDPLAAWVCLAGFLVLNAWALYLWRSRKQLSAYAGLQRFLLAASVIIAWLLQSSMAADCLSRRLPEPWCQHICRTG